MLLRRLDVAISIVIVVLLSFNTIKWLMVLLFVAAIVTGIVIFRFDVM